MSFSQHNHKVILEIQHPPVAATDALLLSHLDSYVMEDGQGLYELEDGTGHYTLESDTGTAGYLLQSTGDKILLS
jgi:hypothetical protein